MDLPPGRGDADVRQHRAAFLGEAGEVEHARRPAFQVRRHAEDGTDGQHAGAADACDQEVEGPPQLGQLGLGQGGHERGQALGATPAARRSLPPSTVTKEGQKPSTQLKSLLQDDWSICRLRPSAVSTGTTERQFDFSEQSPQPSQTASLMKTRLRRVGISPRLRRRRFSAAQVWS